MQKKKGISLIVLVITIIIMIILAAVVIVALNNSGIISKANEAVAKSNINQVQNLATAIWSDAYLDEKITKDDYSVMVHSDIRAANIMYDQDNNKFSLIITLSESNNGFIIFSS